ncbi:putative monovalent cation/H+ antiporter subunit A [Cognataquiflexum aquatile]|uniref:putative monovalent cation/H+ antiporter subunit A n=1 Tax=Cognataquiflexum aquatile TaxID=2249427 RepID=UPI000DE88D6C|nr:putative monovalent cation/H+ antiporter subunit A [Cognataquiflexum aquatile]
MLIAVILGFIFAILVPFFSKFVKKAIPFGYSLLPLSLFIFFLQFLGEIKSKGHILFHYQWVPSLGIDLSFRLDGLSLLFALMITGIGALVFIYTTYYLKGHKYLDRFYGYLSMFMASMLGVVLSDNLMSMFIFWELTSISSYFLIGFNNEDPASRKSALTALSITGFGGLVMLSGIILLQAVGGSYSFTELLNSSEIIKNSTTYGWIIALFFVGAFTKSAQFPFHFWLPGAMKAPTPVSTYLHSATMVKAGIYLLARFTPLLGDTFWWNSTLITVGAVTMVFAAIHSVLRVDLKSILAYSTISALGILVFLIGIGSEKALLAAGIFILAHALYKAALFLITGIIDHETGSRDVTKLAGLQQVMMPVAVAGFIAALSSAGVPLLLGFISKEVMYEATLQFGDWAIILTALAVLTKILLLVAGFWAGIKPFTGTLPAEFGKAKLPSPLLWIPPFLLGVLSLGFGTFPSLITESLIQPVFSSISGSDTIIQLKLWHGFNLVLVLSILTLVSGGALYWFLKPSNDLFQKTVRFEAISPQNIIEGGGKLFGSFAGIWTRFFQNGYLRNYVITILAFLTLLMAYRLFGEVNIYIDWNQISAVSHYEIIVVVLMIISILFAISTNSRSVSIVALGVVGFANCLFFLFYSAPDLAMTQFSIDTLTVLLFMLVLVKLPKNKQYSSKGIKMRDALLSLLFGTLIAILTLEVFEEPSSSEVSKYFAENAYILAKGRNVVNIILVDYRGFDTMIETVVLVIAAVGVYSLMKLNLNPSKKDL